MNLVSSEFFGVTTGSENKQVLLHIQPVLENGGFLCAAYCYRGIE